MKPYLVIFIIIVVLRVMVAASLVFVYADDSFWVTLFKVLRSKEGWIVACVVYLTLIVVIAIIDWVC